MSTKTIIAPKPGKGPGLDKDLDKVGLFSEAAEALGRRLAAPGLALVFIALCAVVAGTLGFSGTAFDSFVLIAAAAIGGYMALNIGANDVANNVGPAVGARVLSLPMALLLAAFFESAGALLAGGDVVFTISSKIIEPSDVPNNAVFMIAMLASVSAAALWINIATIIGAPVSTTHSVVGGVIGAGISAAGFSAVNWTTFGSIAITWIVSPLSGALIAAAFLAFIKIYVMYRNHRIEAARFWLPILLGLMAATFTGYLIIKGLNRLVSMPLMPAIIAVPVVGLAVWASYRPVIDRQARLLDNRMQSLRDLFRLPLIVAAAFMSFGHGANDVANAVGPLAAIVQSQANDISALSYWLIGRLSPHVPVWVSAVGAFGISAGLLLFGSRLIRVVGNQITKLNPIRAFCVTLATATTVLGASAFGMPVSSTHIAVGAIFGVGFFREWYKARYALRSGAEGGRPQKRSFPKNREVRRRRVLVRRSNFVIIIAAWVVTVPAAAALAALINWGLMRILL